MAQHLKDWYTKTNRMNTLRKQFEELGLLEPLPVITKRQKQRHKKVAKYGIAIVTMKRRRKALIERDGEVCKNCGATENLTVDHIIPSYISKNSNLENLQLLCWKCNHEKGIKEAPLTPTDL